MDSASNIKIRLDLHFSGADCLDEVIQYFIRHGFVKGPLLAVTPKIMLEALEFDATSVGDISNPQDRKIRLARLRAKTGKLGTFHTDFVTAVRIRIRKGFERLGRPYRHGRDYTVPPQGRQGLFDWDFLGNVLN